MSRRYLLLCGLLAPPVYIGAVILGGLFRPGYSHMVDTVSELLTAGAPNTALIIPLFTLYHILLIAFGIGLLLTISKDSGRPGARLGARGAHGLVMNGLLGVLMCLFFTQDPGGPPMTATGTMHIILVCVLSLGSMLAMLCVGVWLRHAPGLHGYWRYTLACIVLMAVASGLGAAVIATGSAYFGLAERVAIGTFIQWMFVIALKLSASGTLWAARANASGQYAARAER
jgi:hypothetical protein